MQGKRFPKEPSAFLGIMVSLGQHLVRLIQKSSSSPGISCLLAGQHHLESLSWEFWVSVTGWGLLR